MWNIITTTEVIDNEKVIIDKHIEKFGLLEEALKHFNSPKYKEYLQAYNIIHVELIFEG